MAQECGFFNAELSGDTYDRVYNAEQFAAYFASFIANGVFGNSMGELVVLERTENNMSVDVESGKAWINGWWYRNTERYNLPIAVADGVLNRKDCIVLRWGNAERDMWLQVLQGTPSQEPLAPEIRRDADYYDLKLCEIAIPAGSTKVTQAQITDTRLDNTVCGFVTGVVDQIDTTELYLQFQAQFGDFMDINYEQFDAWFQRMKDQLSEDAAGHLQAEIDETNENVAQLNEDLTLIRSHIGMIIQSTTLDTEAKVIAIYGGTSWSKIEGRVLVGEGTLDSTHSYTINTTGGEPEHTLTVAEMPSHTHSINGINNSGPYNGYQSIVAPGQLGAASIGTTGGDQAHNIMQPYKVVYIWERTA